MFVHEEGEVKGYLGVKRSNDIFLHQFCSNLEHFVDEDVDEDGDRGQKSSRSHKVIRQHL